MNNNKHKTVIGLEVHVELKTKSKMFCGCSADYFGQKPNTYTCPVCLGLPGALPVPNRQAIEWCVMLGLSLNCKIPFFSKFDRKNYFYPDLPKGYQISQYDQPFARNGLLKIGSKIIRITRVHMEEDTAKLIHKTINGEKMTLIDFNRSGVPLVEIVTEPDFENATEVKLYLQKLQQIVRYLAISNADMEKGEMRLEPNISVQSLKFKVLRQRRISLWLKSYRVEVKNINSFSFVEKAINYEIKRQIELIEDGKTPVQETRGWNDKKQQTVLQRVKEEASDYRYFPEPDIPPVRWTELQITNYKLQIPELPDKKFNRFIKQYRLNNYDAEILTRDLQTANYFEDCLKVGKKHKVSAKQIANFTINRKIQIEEVLPAELIKRIISSTAVSKINEKELEKIIDQVLKENEKAVLDFKNGKEQAIMFLVGQVLRKTPNLDANLIKERIKSKI